MPNLLIKHAVENYDDWKPHFDDHAEMREKHGERGYRLYRTADDSKEIVILFDWDDVDNAKEFVESSDLRDVMKEAGVTGEPEVSFLEEIEARTPEKPMA